MQKVITWAGRGALLVVLAVCVVGALDPHYNAKKWAPPADAVMHIIYGYLLTVLSILALPKILINGGRRGFLVGVHPHELVRALEPKVVEVALK